MTADWIKEIPTWEKDYKKMMEGKLSKSQLELLDGAEIKSHEGMIFGGMYSNWKKRNGYDVEENIKPVNNSEDSAE